MSYIGRFAPSPTGPLHFGSLVAALASFLDAKSHRGLWRLRIEDIDPPREQPGATTAILRSLEAHHLFWDGDVLYQSMRDDAYHQALATLQTQGLTSQPGAILLNVETALRSLGIPKDIAFDDLVMGHQQQDVLHEVGDFVIHRSDGLFAYQLAVVVDDIFQGITQVIRGADLLDSTPRQILLFRLLNGPAPVFGHIPLALNREGQKLSKQNLAPALDDRSPVKNMFDALCFLQQAPPESLQHGSLDTLLGWALQNWQITPSRLS